MSAIPPVPDATDDAPPALVATSLGASLTASDLPASLAWYQQTLGFTVARTFERDGRMMAASLRAGTVAILLTQDDGARGPGRAKGEGFSLQLTTTQNVDALADRARTHGATLDTKPTDVWGARVFRLRDPDGFKLVISSERPTDAGR